MQDAPTRTSFQQSISTKCSWCVMALFIAIACPMLASEAEETRPPVQDAEVAWTPKFYGFCMDTADTRRRSIPQQAEMLRNLGFDGAGYPLWFDQNLDKNLKTLDEAGLKVYLLYTSVNVKSKDAPFDPRLPEALKKLKGRNVTISVLMRGLPPGDPQGMEPAVKILRQLGDMAAQSDLRISIYHHTGDWAESLLHALEVVNKTNHPRVGANFNLCHWLKIDGKKDYRPVLRKNASKIFAVTINGARVGAKWLTNLRP